MSLFFSHPLSTRPRNRFDVLNGHIKRNFTSLMLPRHSGVVVSDAITSSNTYTGTGGLFGAESPHGSVFRLPGGNDNGLTPSNTTSFANTTSSGIVCCSALQNGVLLTSASNSSSGLSIRIGGGIFYVIKQNIAVIITATYTDDALFHWYGWTIEGDGTSKIYRVWRDGAKIFDSTATASYAHGISFIGDQGATGGYVPFKGDIAFLAHNKGTELPASYIQNITARGWDSVFARLPRKLLFGPPTAGAIPTLSSSTYKPGTLTTTGWQPRITAS